MILLEKFTLKLLPFVLLAVITYSCNEPAKKTVKKVDKPHSSSNPNQSVINELKSLATNADPLENYHLNLDRSNYYKMMSKEPSTSSDQKYLYKVYSIYELLNAGNSKQCIEELEELLRNYFIDLNNLNENNKPYFELLALAYLRTGEQDNCISNHTKSSCIVPLNDEAIHKNKNGSEKAISIYTKLLQYSPTDYQSRWLINLAYMTIGKYPNEVPEQILIKGIEAKGSRRFIDIASDIQLNINGLSGGTCIDDFNNDGLLDIIASNYSYNGQLKYMINNGSSGFEDRTEEAQLTGLTGGLNLIHADYDNDGFLDVLVLRGGWLAEQGKQQNSLLKNINGEYFLDVTNSAGIKSYYPTQTAVWSDFNNDGHLDLFIGNEEFNCELYQNNGNGTFKNIILSTNISVNAYVKAATAADINNDGYADLYISVLGDNNRLYINVPQEDGSILFEERSMQYGVADPINSFSCWFFDVNNDGWQDLFVGNYDFEKQNSVSELYAKELVTGDFDSEKPKLYINEKGERFLDKTKQYNLEKVLFSMGSNYGDFDNDGFLDFLIGSGSPDFSSVIPNRSFRNNKGESFEETTLNSGLGNIQKGHGVGFADFDNDGDQDIYSVLGGAYEGDEYSNSFYENNSQNNNNWVTLQLNGVDANKFAIGAVILIEGRDKQGAQRRIYRTVSTGGSFGSSSLQQEVGLGSISKIDLLKITWPSKTNKATTFSNVPINQTIRIIQNNTDFEIIERPSFKFSSSSVKQKHHHH